MSLDIITKCSVALLRIKNYSITDCTRFQGPYNTSIGYHSCNIWASNGHLCDNPTSRFFDSNWTSGQFGFRPLLYSSSALNRAWGDIVWISRTSAGMVLSCLAFFLLFGKFYAGIKNWDLISGGYWRNSVHCQRIMAWEKCQRSKSEGCWP